MFEAHMTHDVLATTKEDAKSRTTVGLTAERGRAERLFPATTHTEPLVIMSAVPSTKASADHELPDD